MADDKIADLRKNLIQQGLLGSFEDHLEITRQGKVVPCNDRCGKNDYDSNKATKDSDSDSDSSLRVPNNSESSQLPSPKYQNPVPNKSGSSQLLSPNNSIDSNTRLVNGATNLESQMKKMKIEPSKADSKNQENSKEKVVIFSDGVQSGLHCLSEEEKCTNDIPIKADLGSGLDFSPQSSKNKLKKTSRKAYKKKISSKRKRSLSSDDSSDKSDSDPDDHDIKNNCIIS